MDYLSKVYIIFFESVHNFFESVHNFKGFIDNVLKIDCTMLQKF